MTKQKKRVMVVDARPSLSFNYSNPSNTADPGPVQVVNGTYDAPALFKRTMTYLGRELARAAGMTQKAFKAAVRVECCKVAEYQARGAIHFHVVIRLDAAGKGVGEPGQDEDVGRAGQ